MVLVSVLVSVLETLVFVFLEDFLDIGVCVGVGGFDVAVANDLLEDKEGIDGTELDFVDIGTKGDEDILTLLAFDADDADDFTFGVPRGVGSAVGAEMDVLLSVVDFELGLERTEGTLKALDFDVSILLKAGGALALVLALVLVDGGPDTSENDGILKFTGVGVFLISGEGDGAGVTLYSCIGDSSGVFMLSSGGGDDSNVDSKSFDVLSCDDGLDFEPETDI